MKIKSATVERSKLGYILMLFLFTAGAFYGLNRYPPYFDYDSATMSIFINNLSYNSSYDFGFKYSNEFQDIYRQYWAAHFLPTSIPLSIIQRLFLIPAFKTDIFLKIISLIIGIIGCFFASLLLPAGETKARETKFFLIFISLYAPISFLYFRTAVINIMMSFMLFWICIYIFYLFVHSEKNRYLYILSVVLAYYAKNPYLHLVFLPPIFLGYLIYKKLFTKLLRNKHLYLAAVVMIILYTGITFILAIKYDNSYDSFTQKTEQFLKLRGGSLSLNNLKLNLLADKALKYINQHVFPRHDFLGDRSRDDRLWTFNDIHGPWQALYVLFVIGVIISIFPGKIDDVTILFLIITISILVVCFAFSFPEGRYMLPLVPCYSFFILKAVNFICVKLHISSKFNSLIYSVIVLALFLYTYSLILGSYDKFLLKHYHNLYGLKQGIEYIRNNDQAGSPVLCSNDVNYEALLYNRLYSNFKIALIDHDALKDALSRINRNDTNTYLNVYFLERRATLTDLTHKAFPLKLLNLTYQGFPVKLLEEYNDEFADEPMCLLKLNIQ